VRGSPCTSQNDACERFCFLQVYRDERKVQKLMQPRTLGNPNPAHGPGCQVGATSGTVSGAPRIERTSVSLVSADPVSNAPASLGPGMTCQAPRTSHCTFRSVRSGQPKPCLWPRVPGWRHKCGMVSWPPCMGTPLASFFSAEYMSNASTSAGHVRVSHTVAFAMHPLTA